MTNDQDMKEEDFHKKFPEVRPGDEIEKKPSTIRRIITVAIAILAIVALLSITGIREIVFFMDTSKEATQDPVPSRVESEEITIPLNVVVMQGDEQHASKRSDAEAKDLVKDASNIWSQANIKLNVKNLAFREFSTPEFESFYKNPGEFLSDIPDFRNDHINVFLVSHLRGLNGISFGGVRAVAVADKTTVHDFRVLAHEIGHQLDLEHASAGRDHLMYKGANGTFLGKQAIEKAREKAALLYKN